MSTFISTLFGLVLLIIPLHTLAKAVVKKNLCTITINSNDEAELFKKHLGPANWNVIELVPSTGDAASKSWFNEACKKNIRCDVLIISGHFGGTFFGSSKFSLSMQDLESNSCDQKCDGILKQPREVFLFGCNTLASKEKDHRSPEEYMQVLLSDGFSTTQASQIVSFRYSGFGDSFKHSMTQVFATTPRIYGFTSVGPSGKKIAPLLSKYLVDSAAEYQNFEAYDKKLGAGTNQKLMTAMKVTTIAQARGLIPKMQDADEKPYCYIRSAKKTTTQKLTYIKSLFQDSSAIKILSHIQSFLHEIKSKPQALTDEDHKILSEFAEDEKLKKDLFTLLKLEGDVYLPLKTDVLNTLKDLGIVNNAFVTEAMNKMIDLRSPFTEMRKNMLCSLQLKINIPFESIPAERWNELEFLSSLVCIKPQDLAIQKRVAQLITEAASAIVRGTAIWLFYSQPTVDIEIQKSIATSLRTDSETYVRQSAAMVLRQLKPTSTEVIRIIVEAYSAEKDPNVRAQTLEVMSALK